MKTCVVIGISDSREQWFPPEVMDAIRRGSVFSGGRRHHEIVASLLPAGAVWIDITVPLGKVFEQYARYDHVVIFASGDPLFFGFANTIQRECPDVEMRVFPSPNSLQMLAHRMCLPYHDMRMVSLTGRDWKKCDEALIVGEPLIGCLTDRVKTPHTIHQRMVEYGYTNYVMTVGENLGNEEKERVSRYDAQAVYDHPNCVILQRTAERVTPFGIPDSDFALLDGREKMITKMPIRLLTLQALDLRHKHVFWDIGFCTGSVSIEARLQFPHLQVESFEIRPECEAIIRENARRHGAPGIGVHIGDFCSVCCDDIATKGRRPDGESAERRPDCEGAERRPDGESAERRPDGESAERRPDAVFIGGHGGRLKEIMAKVVRYLRPGGCIVMNSVKAPKVLTDSHQLWDEACQELGLQQEPPTRIVLNDNHPIEILKASPVF